MLFPRSLALIFLAATLGGCGFSAAIPGPLAQTAAGAAAPTRAAPSPTVRRVTATKVPTKVPTRVATRLPTRAPTRVPPPPASSTPVPTAPAAALPPPLNVADQAGALLPEFAGDLAGAERWDRYSLAVALDPAGLTVGGGQRVELRNRSSTVWSELYFHLYPNHPDFGGGLRVEDVRVDGQPAAVTTEQNNLLLRVPLSQPLAPGAAVTVTMQLLARTQRNASNSAYGAFNQEAGVWSLASFYPVLARYSDGAGWDRRVVTSRGDFVVSDTALYELTVEAPEGWALVTSGARVGAEPLAGGGRRERFVSGPQREFLLTALQGLEQASSEVDGTRITAYYQPGNAQAGRSSLEVAEQSLKIFNQRYGRYPLAELDVIQAALTSFYGVEYPGIVLIEQNLYRRGDGLRITVAHEVAHQWWYSLVGNDAQGDPWLDEGLASFSQIVYYEGLGDNAGAAAELAGFRASLLRARQQGRDGVSDRPAAAFQGNYVALVYAKPALFLQALRLRIGDELFFRFIQDYYSSYRYGNASGGGLLDAAQRTCGCDLQAFYTSWVSSGEAVELP